MEDARLFRPMFLCALVLITLLRPFDSRAAEGPSTIVDAARRGDIATLRTLIQQRVDVNAAGVDGGTALLWAAHRGDIAAVTLLLSKGANVATANRYGVTPLRAACVHGSVAVVEALLKASANPNETRDESGDTPLMIAARAGHTDVVRMLLARGAHVNAVEPRRQQTALMWAAAERHSAVVKVLLEGGADLKALSSTKISPLMFAIRAGDIDSVRVLLDAGLDVNAPASDGTSMLVLALLNARFELATVLLERGADPNVDDPHGRPLHVVAFLRRAENIALSTVLPRQLPQTGVDAFAIASALLKHGADINARYATTQGRPPGPPRRIALGSYRVGFAGGTPFFISAITSDAPFMRFLAANGADPAIPSLGNVTPLLAASGVGFWEGETPGTQAEALEAIKVAYELGNDPKAVVQPSSQTSDASWVNATAMHGAANRGAVDMIQWLADKGVPLDAKSSRGLSPYHIAAGLEGGQFHAWPDAAALILKIARERGETIDTSEPPKTGRGLY